MRQTRHRRCFSHAVALNYRIAKVAPESLGFALESRTACDEGPEAPAKLAVNLAKRPPVSKEVTASGRLELVVRNFSSDLLAQGFEHARHGDDDIDASLLYRADDLRGFVSFTEIDLRAEQLRNEHAKQLSEHVAQRQQAKKTQRMNESFPALVTREFFFDGRDVGEEISMCETDAFRFGGRAGSENDLDQIVGFRLVRIRLV